MLLVKASDGYIAFLTQQEQTDEAVIEELERLKKIHNVALLISGSQDCSEIMYRLLQNCADS